MPYVIAGVVIVVVVVAVVMLGRRRRGSVEGGSPVAASGTSERLRPPVAEFHIGDGAARVHFDVPLPADGADPVLTELLGREAVEVVREKRHTLPLGELHRVIALGRSGREWVEVTTIGLDTPGELPPPVFPELIPHATQRDFDPFERLSDLPAQAPGLAGGTRGEDLGPLPLRLPVAAEAGLRAQGIDPGAGDTLAVVLGLMRSAGYAITPQGRDSYRAVRAGGTTFIRTVPHAPGDHPELEDGAIRRFVVDFGGSGAGRGLLITEKYAPFEIYDRERRDARMRFVARERLQSFADALVLG